MRYVLFIVLLELGDVQLIERRIQLDAVRITLGCGRPLANCIDSTQMIHAAHYDELTGNIMKQRPPTAAL